MSRERQRHKLTRDLDYEKLRDTLSARLNQKVELVARPPADGIDGEILVVSAETNEPIPVDPTVVQSLISLAPARPDTRSLEQIAVEEIDAASTPAAQVDAIRSYLQRLVETETARFEATRQQSTGLETFFNVIADAQSVSHRPTQPEPQVKLTHRNSRPQPPVREGN